MRIYRDLELVESLGSGIPRIISAYGENCFRFTDNFIRITFPVSAQAGTKKIRKDEPYLYLAGAHCYEHFIELSEK